MDLRYVTITPSRSNKCCNLNMWEKLKMKVRGSLIKFKRCEKTGTDIYKTDFVDKLLSFISFQSNKNNKVFTKSLEYKKCLVLSVSMQRLAIRVLLHKKSFLELITEKK